MYRFFKYLFIVSILVIAAGFPVIAAHAAPAIPAPAYQETAPDIFTILDNLRDLAKTAGTLTGFALLFSAAINLGKQYKPELFPDGSAPAYNLGFQTLTLVILVILQIAGRTDLIPVFDQSAGLVANLLTAFVALGYQFWASRVGHANVLAGLPGIGFSHSGRQAGENFVTQIDVLSDDFEKAG